MGTSEPKSVVLLSLEGLGQSYLRLYLGHPCRSAFNACFFHAFSYKPVQLTRLSSFHWFPITCWIPISYTVVTSCIFFLTQGTDYFIYPGPLDNLMWRCLHCFSLHEDASSQPQIFFLWNGYFCISKSAKRKRRHHWMDRDANSCKLED